MMANVTSKVTTIIALLISFSIIIGLGHCDNTDTLLSAVVVFRHGDRTPLKFYPDDPYQEESYWPEGFGQLTNEGKLRHYELGKWFRQRYNGFLSEQYTEKEIYVQSTDVDRTLMSASANLAGLYPPKDNQIWNSELIWQPIPIHTKPVSDDAVLAMEKYCPKYDNLLIDLYNSDFFLEIQSQNQELYQFLSNQTGESIETIDRLEYLYDTLFIESSHNLTLPEWTEQVYPEPLKKWAEFDFSVYAYNTDLARLATGPFFNEIITHFNEKTNDTANTYQKFRMYSGHDSNIADILQSMKAYENSLPPYASALIFELRQTSADNNNSFYINIFYKNSTDSVHNIILNGCNFNCDLKDFITILKPITIDLVNWEIECQDNQIKKLF